VQGIEKVDLVVKMKEVLVENGNITQEQGNLITTKMIGDITKNNKCIVINFSLFIFDFKKGVRIF
jgi:hypothetical protein